MNFLKILGIDSQQQSSFLKLYFSLLFLSLVVLLSLTKYYESEFKIISYGGSGIESSSLGGLVSSIGGTSALGGNSSEKIVNVPEVMLSVVRSESFMFKLQNKSIESGQYKNIIIEDAYKEFYNIKPSKNIDDLNFKINKKLKEHITISKDRQTNIIHVKVEVFDPNMAQSMAKTIMEMLTEETIYFSSEVTNKKIGFIKDRLMLVTGELTELEDSLRKFKSKNKIATTPLLELELNRIVREVSMKNTVYQSLNRELELLKLKLVESSSDLYSIEEPTFPYKKSRPSRLIGLLLSIINCFVLTYSYVFISKTIRNHN